MRATETRQICGVRTALAICAVLFLTTSRDANAEEPQYRVELHAPKNLPNCNDLDGFIEELNLALDHSLLGSLWF